MTIILYANNSRLVCCFLPSPSLFFPFNKSSLSTWNEHFWAILLLYVTEGICKHSPILSQIMYSSFPHRRKSQGSNLEGHGSWYPKRGVYPPAPRKHSSCFIIIVRTVTSEAEPPLSFLVWRQICWKQLRFVSSCGKAEGFCSSMDTRFGEVFSGKNFFV